MSWYYAENNERRGPIEDPAFDALVAAGSVRPETLVWRDGMTGWLALSASNYRPSGAPLPPGSDSSTDRPPAVEMGVCSESGRILPRSELVEIDGKLVSAEYKHVVLQRIREGVGSSGSAIDPEVLAQEILARDYHLSIGSCFSRAWQLLTSNFWLCVGGTFLSMLVNQAVAFIPVIGPLIMYGPLTAGLYWMTLRLIRKEPASLGDAFAGFTRNFGHLVAAGAIAFVVAILCFAPGLIAFLGSVAISPKDPSTAGVLIGMLLWFVGIFFMIYFWVGWALSFLLIIDKQMDFWPAMKLSRRIVGMHWWQVFGVLFVAGLPLVAVVLVGMMVFFAGLGGMIAMHDHASIFGTFWGLVLVVVGLIAIVVMPLKYSALAAAYEDIFGPQGGR